MSELIRHAKGVTPTPAGHIVIDRARALLREVDALSADVGRTRREITGHLHLGYIAQTLNEQTPGPPARLHRR